MGDTINTQVLLELSKKWRATAQEETENALPADDPHFEGRMRGRIVTLESCAEELGQLLDILG